MLVFLKLYQNYTIQEWVNRGYKNNMQFEEILILSPQMPKWFGDEAFHRSHRSNLLRKDYEYYRNFFDEPIDLEYSWPV